jgi:Amt family ammonium transporter
MSEVDAIMNKSPVTDSVIENWKAKAANRQTVVFCSTVKNSFGYDDSLDVFGIHAVGGILGAIGTGILVNTALGGAGIPDYESKPGELAVGAYAFGTVVWTQTKAVLFTIAWTGIGSFILYKIVDLVIGLRVTAEQEREGLDIAEHGERAYNY